MNICISLLWDFILGLFAYILKNPIFVLIMFAIMFAVIFGIGKKMGALMIGIILTVVDFLKDSVDIGTFGLSTPITIMIGIGIGFGWAMMALSSNAGIISFINAIPMFLFGTILGIAQIPFLAIISAVAGFAIQNSKTINYLMGIISAFLLYFVLSFSFALISGFCQGLDYAVSLF